MSTSTLARLVRREWLIVSLLLLLIPHRGTAQAASGYDFSSFNGRYAALVRPSLVVVNSGGGNTDDGYSTPITLPFTFRFASADYSTVTVSSNGYVGFGTHTTAFNFNVLRGAEDKLVAFCNTDLVAGVGGSTYGYQTAGQAPNRIFKVEATNFQKIGNNTSKTGNAQVWLYEGTNEIEVRYGAFGQGWGASVTAVIYDTVRVGLRGAGITDLAAIKNAWTAPVKANSAAAGLRMVSASQQIPASGQVFHFTPQDQTPPVIGPVTLTPGSSCAPTSHQITVSPTDDTGIGSVTLTYAVGATSTTVPMTPIQGFWTATIPAQGTNPVVYTVLVKDSSPQQNESTVQGIYTDGLTTVDAGPDQSLPFGATATLQATVNANAALKISEITLDRTLFGATVPPPAYIGNADDFVEISNLSANPISLTGYTFQVLGANPGVARTYAFPATASVPARGVLVLHLGTGTDAPAFNYYHTGGAEALLAGADVGFLLRAPVGTLVDAVAVNGFSFSPTMPGAPWLGAGVTISANSPGAQLVGADTDDATNWSQAFRGNNQTLGTLNPNLPTISGRVSWTGGVLTGPTTANPATTPAHTTPGSYVYTVTLLVAGCTITDQLTVTVAAPPPPVAAFSASATAVTTADVVTLTDQSTNQPTAWAWSFAPNTVQFRNNTTATSQNPQVQFTATGCYTVTLTATNAGGSDAEVKTSYICVSAPTCTIRLQFASCSDTHINAVQIPTTTLNNTGTGCNNGTGLAYTVYPATGSTTASLQAGQTYALSVTTSSLGSIGAWLDTNGDGTLATSEFINVQQVGVPGPMPVPAVVLFTVPLTAPGGLVRLRVRNSQTANSIDATNACTARSSGETEDYFVTLLPACVLPAPTVQSNSPVCVGDTLTLTAANVPTGTVGYAWTGPNNFFSQAAAPRIPNVTTATAGRYTLVLTQGTCTSPPVTTSVTISLTPAAPADFNAARCGPGTVTLNVPLPSTAGQYRWYTTATGGQPIAGTSGPSYTTPSLSATTVFYVSFTSGSCESARATATAIVNPLPAATLTPVGSTTLCAGQSLVLRATPRGRNANGAPLYRYLYYLDGTPTGGTSPPDSLVVSVAGAYTVRVTDNSSSSCEATSAPVNVTVNPQATAGFGYNARVYCQNQVPNPTPTITGTTGGTFTATPTGVTLNAQTGQITLATSAPATYQITYSVGGPCPATATHQVIINRAPSAVFSYAPASACAGSATTLTATLATGATAGTFSATPTGLALNPQTGTVSAANSQSGSYVVTNTIPAGNQCAAVSASATITIDATPVPTISASGNTTFCAGGSVTLTASGGTSYLWNTGATTASITATATGQYSVTATNAAGCAATSQATAVTVTPQPSAAFAYGAGTYCLSGLNPTPTISGATGGTFSATPVGLALNAQTGAITLATSAAGTYSVTYTISGQCPATQSQTVTLTTAPSAAFTYSRAGVLCAGAAGTVAPNFSAGASAGSFTATPTGLALATSSGIISLANSQPGTYVVTNTIAAANGCAASSATATVVIQATPTPTISASGNTTFCAGGSVVLTASGGTSYLWSTGATTASVTATATGQYSVTATNAAGCAVTSQTTGVTVLPQPSAAFAYGAGTYCLSGLNPTPTISGATGGTFSATPAGLVLNAQTGAITLASSAAATYSVTYSLGGTCPATQSQTVTLTTAPAATFTYPRASVLCAGGTGTVAPTFSTGASAGSFTATPTGLALAASSGIISLANSQAGTYVVTNTIAAANGCAASSASATVVIQATPTPTISASGNTTFCAGGSVVLTASGGTSYLWSTGATTASITATATGPYSVTATNAAGCAATSQATAVTVTPQPSAAFAYGAGTYCLSGTNPAPTVTGASGGAFSATPAGLVLNAQTGAITLASSAAGTYSVTYSLGGTCPATQSQTVTLTTAPAATFTYPRASVLCAGGTGTVAPTFSTGASAGSFTATPAGLALAASSGIISLANSQAGTYVVTNTIAAANGCAASSASATVVIQAVPTPTISATGNTTFCAGGSVVLTASGGTSYLWSTGATTASITATATGSYSVTATNAAGCAATSQATAVTVTPQPSAAFAYGAGTYCLSGTNPTPTVAGASGGTFSATPAGLTLNAQTGAITLASSVAGTYTVTYNVPGQCPAAQSQSVTLTTAPSAAFAYPRTGVLCAGAAGTVAPSFSTGASAGSFTATPAGLALAASSGIISLANSQAGTYVVTNTIAAANGCAASSASATIVIQATPTPTISASGNTTFCASGSVVLTASGGTSYLWSTGATTASITATATGQYSVTATNAAGCAATSQTTGVTVLPQPSAAFAYGAGTYCLSGTNPTPTVAGASGGTFSATPSGLALNAQTGAITLASSAAGTYTVTYNVAGQCPAAQSQSVTLTTAPSAAFAYPRTGVLCAGAAGTLTPTFSTGASAGSFTATPAGLALAASSGIISLANSQAGTYVVTNTIAAANGCAASSASATITINATPTPTISASGNTTFCAGGSVVLTASGGTSYVWNTGATTASITATATGQYSVTATNAAGCAVTSQTTGVTVLPQPSAAFAYGAGTYCLSGTNPTPTVAGASGGTFSATPSGLALNAQTGAITLAASTAGTYTVTYNVLGQCPATQSQTVTLTTAPAAAFTYGTAGPQCAGGTGTLAPSFSTGASAGSFTATPTGLALAASSGVISLASSAPGTYVVTNTIAAANGCAASSATATVVIQAVPTPTISASGNTTFCAGGSVVLTASGGTSYLWNTGATTASITATATGSYSVTATNTAGCAATSQTTGVTVLPQPSAAFAYGAGTYCLSGTNPTPTVTGASGGTFSATPAGLTLNTQTGAITLASSVAGTYTVTYNVSGQCPATQSQSVTLTTAPAAAFTYGTSGPRCAGGTGTITPTFNAGASAGSFTATPAGLALAASSGVISLANSQAGTYVVTNTIAAANGCAASSASATVVIQAVPTPTISASGNTTFCAGGSVVLTASGGTSYLWSTGATTASITATATGQYSVTATNAAGCAATSQTTGVTVLPQPSAAFAYGAGTYCLSGTNPTPTVTGASGGTFNATPVGLTINTQTGAITLASSVAGTYTVTYNVPGTCPATQSQSVTLTTAPAAAFTYGTSGPRCAGGTGTITPTFSAGASAGSFTATPSGLALAASSGIISLANSQAGTYVVTNTITAANGCAASSASATVVIQAVPTPTISASGNTTFCAGGSVVLTASGGTSYVWNTGATTASITATATGQYSVTATNAAGCAATSQATAVTVTPQPSAAFAYGAGTYCLSGTNPTPTISGATGGTFSATPVGLVLNAQTGAITLASSAAGTYSVTYSLGGTCPATQSQSVTLTTAPAAAFTYGTAGPQCAGGTGTLAPTFSAGASAGSFTATPTGLALAASSGIISLANSQAGTYVVTNTIAAANGCAASSASATVVIQAVPVPTISASGNTTFCAGGSVTLTASGGTSYLWSTGATTASITATATGPYSVTATNASGCAATSAVTTVTVTPQPSAAFAYGAGTYCLSGTNPTPTVTGASGGTFSATPVGLVLNAQTGAITLTASVAGTYTVTYNVGGQCPATQSQSVTLTTAPAAAFTYGTSGPRCAGGTGTITPTFSAGASAGSFTATPSGLALAASSGIISLANSQAGTYVVTNTITAANGCAASSASATVVIQAVPTPTISASGNTTFCAGGSVVLTASGGTSYLWSTGATTASLTVTATGSYSVTATNAAGCAATSQATAVTVTPQPSAVFAYGAGTYCLSGLNPTPTVTGASGGTFSATPVGLVLNAQTGAIALASSAAGTYSVTYSLGGTCPATQSQTVTLTTAPAAAFTYGTAGPQCAGGTGTLAPTFSAGASAGSFTATPAGLALAASSGMISLANSQAGTYVVTNSIAAANGCAASSASATITINATPVPTISASGNTTFCAGGSVMLTASGGTSYLWSTGATTASITATATGQYSVTATNAAGCAATSTVTTVTVTPQPSAAFAYGAGTYCLSGTNPTPTVTGASGGTFSATPVGLVLNAQTGAITLTASVAGTYTVTYNVGGQCPATQSQTVTLTTAPAAAFTYGTSGPRCAGGTGTVAPTFSAGASAGSFTATPAGLALAASSGIISLANSQAGTYVVTNTIAAANGCAASSASATVVIQATPVPTISASGNTTFCAGGSVVLTASGGTSYLWSTGATTASLTVTATGSYSVTATNAAGCAATSQATAVTVTPQPSAVFAYGAGTYCLSGTNPTPTVTGASGGTFSATPVGLVLNAQTGAIALASSAAGTYSVTYSLGGTCPATQSQTVTLTTAPAAAFTYGTAGPQCAGGTGTLAPTFSAGASAGSFTATPTGLALAASSGIISLANSQAGTYVVTNTIAAANGCAASSASATVVIQAVPVPTISASGNTTFCAGGSVMLTASGGTSYLWSTGATTASITATATGQYSVTATNAAGCAATSQTTGVTVLPQPSAAFAYGAGTYCLSGTNPTPTVTGASGGTFSAAPAGLTLNAQTGAITLAASTAGAYTVTYNVAGQCPATHSQTVTVTTAPAAAFTYGTSGPQCAGGTGTVAPTFNAGASAGSFTATPAGLALAASSGMISLANSQAGTYVVTNSITAANGCAASSATATVVIQATPVPTISASGNTTFCAGGSVVLTASGGTSYVWNTGATTASITATATGQYSVTATNAAGCAATSQTTGVTVLPQPSAAFAYSAGTYCLSGTNPTPTVTGASGGTFNATPVGLTINAQTGAITLASSVAGTYTVTYNVPGQCPATQSQSVTLTTAPAAAFTYGTSGPRCAGGTGTLAPIFSAGASAGSFTATPAGLALAASSGVISLANSQAGTYVVTNSITAANGCAASSATATVVIQATPVPTISASGNTTFCAGGSVVLTASGGTSYLWNTGATTVSITATATGQYSVMATNAAGCAATSQTTGVTVLPQPSAAFAYGAGTYCLSGTNPTPTISGATGGTFSATPVGLTINAQTGAITLASSVAGTYTVTYNVPGQCPATQSQTVTLTTAPAAAFTYGTSGPRCAGGTGTVAPTFSAGASAGSFTATPSGLALAASSGIISLANSQAGTYVVTNTITAANGCAASSASATVVIQAVPTPTISASGNTTFCAGGSVVLTASGGTSYLWSTGATTASITATATGQYSVTATNAAGCAATSQATAVTVTPQPSAAFAYGAGTYCLSGTNPTPTVTGASGGTFSATPVGLTLNAQTGAITLTASVSGTYTVTYNVPGTCPATQSQTVTLTTAPAAAFTYGTAVGCANTPGSLTPVFDAGSTAGTFMATPAGLVIDATTGVIDLSTSVAGAYTISNVITGGMGCSTATNTFSLTLLAVPTVAIANLNLTYCTADGPTTLSGTVNGSVAPGTFTIDGQSATIFDPLALGAGPHLVAFTGSAGGPCAATITATVVVTATPVQPVITLQPLAGGQVQLTSSQPTGNQWYLNGQLIPGATDSTYVVTDNTQNGNYTVICTVAGCPSSASAPVSVQITGLPGEWAGATLAVYPNPTADGRVTLALTGCRVPSTLTVYDAIGRAVRMIAVPAGAGTEAAVQRSLDLATLPTGQYLLRLVAADGRALTRRLVRE